MNAILKNLRLPRKGKALMLFLERSSLTRLMHCGRVSICKGKGVCRMRSFNDQCYGISYFNETTPVLFLGLIIFINNSKTLIFSIISLPVSYKVKRLSLITFFSIFIYFNPSLNWIGLYNKYLMSSNQRTTSFFHRNKSQGRSLHVQTSYLTPKILRKPHASIISQSKASYTKYSHANKQRIHGVSSESLLEKDSPLKKLIFLRGKSQLSQNARTKYRQQELRETDDSFKPNNRKDSININHFKIIRQLGRGKHGTVFLAIHKQTGFIGALKVFVKQQIRGQNEAQRVKLQQQLIRQFKIQSFISHENIIKLYCIFSDKDFLYAFMELGADGQLYDIFQKRLKLREQTISFVIRSLLNALNYLHANGIIHRDVKPENIVLIHGFPKICDFGQSNFYSKQKGQLRETLCGTPLYLSPQILNGDKYDEKIDIWALGATAYELFTSMNPFNIKKKDELRRIITEQFKMTTGSIQICNFFTHCLKKHPLQRPSATKLLKHPFIVKWRELETAEQLCNCNHP